MGSFLDVGPSCGKSFALKQVLRIEPIFIPESHGKSVKIFVLDSCPDTRLGQQIVNNNS